MNERCQNEHDLAPGHDFCPRCGAPRAGAEEAATPPAPAGPVPPPAPSAAPPATGKMTPARWAAVAGGVGLVAVVALTVGAGGGEHTITGTLELTDPDGYSSDFGCSGASGYDDISAGAEVVVRNGEGETLATSGLDSGEEVGEVCVFSFEVAGVPTADFYEIEVSHRGGLTFSHEEMESQGWDVGFSLG